MRFALIGNPNSGKTTLFNTLTGASAHVGNWPGVTVEQKIGQYKKLDENIEIVDLPGIYSLSPYTPEEIVSRNFLIDEKPDLVINIIDATNIVRNLYLTTQLLEIDVPVVIALNMMDVVRKGGDTIDVDKLSSIFHCKVVEISALRNEGIKELMEVSKEQVSQPRKGKSYILSGKIKDLYDEVINKYERLKLESPVFHTIKIIENDEIEVVTHPSLNKEVLEAKQKIFQDQDDFDCIVADARYNFIAEKYKEFYAQDLNAPKETKSDKIDKVLTHRIFSIPIFLGVMLLVFHLTFGENLFFLGGLIPDSFDNAILGSGAINSPGVILFNIVDILLGNLGGLLETWLSGAPSWVSSLLIDGVYGGVSAVMSFIPQILCLFFFLSILEDTGYMARVAFVMDRILRRFGLSGKAFMPLLMCFGCAVPGIMGTRTLEDPQERKMAIMLTPFFSCGAKLPIWLAFAGVLFAGKYADIITFSIYLLGIVVSIITALILRRTALKGKISAFVLELPDYRMPAAKNLGLHLWEKLKDYLFRAATIIAGASVVLWFLSSFNWNWNMVDVNESILADLAHCVSFIFRPLGFAAGDNGWMYIVASLTGLIAKEEVPATLETLSALNGMDFATMVGLISVPAAFAFMAFNLLVIPCMAAVATARMELNNRRHFWLTMLFWFVTAYVVSFIIYMSGTYMAFAICLGVAILLFVLFEISLSIYKHKKVLRCQ